VLFKKKKEVMKRRRDAPHLQILLHLFSCWWVIEWAWQLLVDITVHMSEMQGFMNH
jgi:hypothetical protein